MLLTQGVLTLTHEMGLFAQLLWEQNQNRSEHCNICNVYHIDFIHRDRYIYIYSMDLSDFALFAVLLIHWSEHTCKFYPFWVDEPKQSISPLKVPVVFTKPASHWAKPPKRISHSSGHHASPVLITNAGSRDVSHPDVSPSESVGYCQRPFLWARFEKQSRCLVVAPPFQTADETAVTCPAWHGDHPLHSSRAMVD